MENVALNNHRNSSRINIDCSLSARASVPRTLLEAESSVEGAFRFYWTKVVGVTWDSLCCLNCTKNGEVSVQPMGKMWKDFCPNFFQRFIKTIDDGSRIAIAYSSTSWRARLPGYYTWWLFFLRKNGTACRLHTCLTEPEWASASIFGEAEALDAPIREWSLSWSVISWRSG